MEISWRCSEFCDLNHDELYALLQLRAQVFVVEQDCVYQDMDDLDQNALHLTGWTRDGKLAAYSRILLPGTKFVDAYSIGRVVTGIEFRREGLGKELMQQALDLLSEKFSTTDIRISAQQYLEKFYNGFGFVKAGDPYLEDGIPHLEMSWNPEG